MKSARALRASFGSLRGRPLVAGPTVHSRNVNASTPVRAVVTRPPLAQNHPRARDASASHPPPRLPTKKTADQRWASPCTNVNLPPLSSVLPNLPPPQETSLPAHQWRQLLNHPHGPSDLLALMPYLPRSLDHMSFSAGVKTLAMVLRYMGNFNMLAPVSEVVRMFDLRLTRAMREDANLNTLESLEGAYKTLIKALTTFHRQSTIPTRPTKDKLNRSADEHVLRLVKSLVTRLDGLPSSSTQPGPGLSHDMLRMLFDRPLLHPALMNFLLNHTRSRGVECTSWMWWRCFLLAVDQGDEKAARRFRTKAAQAAKREAKTERDEQSALTLEADGVESGSVGSEVDLDRTAPSGLRTERDTQGSRTDRLLSTSIRDLINARTHRRLELVVVDVEDRLRESDLTSGYAWSHLINVSRKDDTVTSTDLAQLQNAISEEAVTSQAYTSAMLGLLERGDTKGAWEVWRDLIERERQSVSASPEDKQAKKEYVDCVSVAVGTHVCYALLGLEAAIKLVDAWAKRPHDSHDDSTTELERSVILDATNVNVLLTLCRRERKPGIALRIFKAALPRWGVYTDDISLTLLLDTCKHLDFSQKEGDTLRDRLRQLADELRLPRSTRTDKYEAYDAAGFSKGPTSVLLDQPGLGWRAEHHDTPWSTGRSLFRDVLLSNWPYLGQVKSPLDFETGPYAHLSRDISSFFRFSPPSTTNMPTIQDIPLNPNYIHLVPSANTFQSYITLLGYHNLPHEIPLALSWMRYLHITPTRRTMLLALTYLGEVEGPRRVLADWEDGKSKLVRDTEVMRRWLGEWVPKGVPSEDQVAEFRRETVEAGRRLTA